MKFPSYLHIDFRYGILKIIQIVFRISVQTKSKDITKIKYFKQHIPVYEGIKCIFKETKNK